MKKNNPTLASPKACCDSVYRRAWWEVRTSLIPEEHWDTAPLFLRPGCSPNDLDLSCAIQSSDVLALVRSDAQLCGLNPSEFKGNAYRVGGASDLRDAPFTENGPPIDTVTATRLIKARGRWYSDIFTIYERASLKEHARASAAIPQP